MSPEEEQTVVESPEEAGEEAAKKGRSKLMLFGGLGITLAVVAVALVFFMGGSDESSAEWPEAQQEMTEDTHGADKGEEPPKKHASGKSVVYAIDDIVVNPAGTGGSRFLSVSFGFELGSAELSRQFETREALVRDALITILSSKSVAELTDPRQKEITRYQIKKRLEQLMASEDLKAVYFTDFVLQ